MANNDDLTKGFPSPRQLPAGFGRLRDGCTIVVSPVGSRLFGPDQAPENSVLLVDGIIRVQQTSEGRRERSIGRREFSDLRSAGLGKDSDHRQILRMFLNTLLLSTAASSSRWSSQSATPL